MKICELQDKILVPGEIISGKGGSARQTCTSRNEEEKTVQDILCRNGGYAIWGDEDCQNAFFDDVRVYDGVLTAFEVQALCE